MAKINVTSIILTIDGSPLAHCKSGTLNIDQDLFDSTTKDSAGWAEHGNGLRSWNIDVEGLIDYSSSAGVDELADAIINRTPLSVIFATATSGDTKYNGTVNPSNLSQGGGLEEAAAFSGSLTGTGPLTKGAVA